MAASVFLSFSARVDRHGLAVDAWTQGRGRARRIPSGGGRASVNVVLGRKDMVRDE